MNIPSVSNSSIFFNFSLSAFILFQVEKKKKKETKNFRRTDDAL